ncbi:MAG: hypothetical protein VX343_00705 [Thermodesulfobacteriota bacterium]|nr:hypothetical protein [Thermodesulfobacteriota bacterium]
MDSKTKEELLKVASKSSDYPFLLECAISFIHEGDYMISIDLLNRIDETKGYLFEKNYYIALCYKGQNKLDEAIKFCGVALRANPDYLHLYPLTASLCFQNNMIEEGDKLMKILKEKDHFFFQHVAGIVVHYKKNN